MPRLLPCQVAFELTQTAVKRMVITSTLIHAAIVVILGTEVKHTVRLTASIGFHLLTYAWNFVKLKLSPALKRELLTAFSPLIKQPDAHLAPPPTRRHGRRQESKTCKRVVA